MREITSADFSLDQIVIEEDCIFDPDIFIKAGRKTKPAIIVKGSGITIDFNGAELNGETFKGYGVYLRNCHDVTIKNADIKGYFYGVCAERCSDIRLLDNIVSENYDDPDAGWLHETYKGDVKGLGGGILLKRTTNSLVKNNTLIEQFNGLDLIFCDNIQVFDNNCSNNRNWGLHLLKTHRCTVIENNMDDCIRYLPNGHDKEGGCDSAGILMEEGSHYNRFIRNSFRHGGDGVYIRANNHKRSNYNYFAYNDASGSPHNAFEDGFGIGNVYEYNIASDSDYGFWAYDNYSGVFRGNIVSGNTHDGIAMLYGKSNTLVDNIITENGGAGVRMWWTDHELLHDEPSCDHLLRMNRIMRNKHGVWIADSQRITFLENYIVNNEEDFFERDSEDIRFI